MLTMCSILLNHYLQTRLFNIIHNLYGMTTYVNNTTYYVPQLSAVYLLAIYYLLLIHEM